MAGLYRDTVEVQTDLLCVFVWTALEYYSIYIVPVPLLYCMYAGTWEFRSM